MTEPKKLHLPRPHIPSLPTADEMALSRAHIEGMLLYEAVDYPCIKLRIVPT